jgi:23S rRNA (adenine2030-N6)-methyltransferase
MEATAMRAYERGVMATGIRDILQLELAVKPDGLGGSLRGCGLLVVNPPFGFEEIARSILGWLWPVLSRDRDGGQTVRWLAGE